MRPVALFIIPVCRNICRPCALFLPQYRVSHAIEARVAAASLSCDKNPRAMTANVSASGYNMARQTPNNFTGDEEQCSKN